MFTSIFPATRWSLIYRCSEDPSAMQWMIEHYIEGIARYLHIRMRYAAEEGIIDDLVGEVALTLLQRPQILENASKREGRRFHYFMMTVAHNLARNAYRRLHEGSHVLISDAQVQEAIAQGQVEAAGDFGSSIEDMDRAWAMGVLSQAWQDMGGLVEAEILEQSTLTLLRQHLLEDQSLRQLAHSHGMSLTTCQRRVAAGKHHLQKLLRQRLSAVDESYGNDVDVCSLLLQALAGTTTNGESI